MGKFDSDCNWFCDSCRAYLNSQPGFTTESGIWTCTKCGFINDVSKDNIISEEEVLARYEASKDDADLSGPRRATGFNIQVGNDNEGGLISVQWYCPYCGDLNYGFYFVSDVKPLSGDFEVDNTCDTCGKAVIIECRDASHDLFG